jgi:hypothetical protein
MSLENDPGYPETTNNTALFVGLVAIIIVGAIGIFILLNTQTGKGFFGLGTGVNIGFDFTDQRPADRTGDGAAKSHLFVHRHPLPGAGLVTGITYLNDEELRGAEISETIIVFILRPAGDGWKITGRIPLPADDDPPATSGMTTFKLESPLTVEEGDIFAHWQPEETGPIPVNYENKIMEGLSAGQFGFSASDLGVGQIIREDGFSGQRDYFINLIFEPAR